MCPLRIRGDGGPYNRSPQRLSTPEPRGTKNAPNWAFTLARAYCVHVTASLKLRPLPLLAASSWEIDGAGEGNRTRDLRITSAPLYQLSYAGPQSLRKCYVISSGCACQSTTRRCRGAHRHYPHSCERLRAFALGSKASLLLGAAVHKNGADDGIRTRDSRLGKPLPYHWATSARKASRLHS